MAHEIVETENPLKKFDAETLKAIGSTAVEGSAPRSLFLPSDMGEAMELAKLMAASNFVAPHMRGKPGDCLAIVMQATRWGMDPFAVGNKTFFVNDRIAFESQLVNAVVNTSNVLDGRLKVSWEGEGNDLVCFVAGRIKGDPDMKSRRVPIKNITTRNSPLWKQDPEQQLGYYATRAWARLHTPEVLMGVYTPDEVREMTPIDGGQATPAPATTRKLTSGMLQSQATDEHVGEGREDGQMGEDHTDPVELSAAQNFVNEMARRAAVVADQGEYDDLEIEVADHLDSLPPELIDQVNAALDAAQARVAGNFKRSN